MIDYSLCEVRNMNIEIGGINIISMGAKPGSEPIKVDLKKPIIHTVSRGLNGFAVTAYLKGYRRPQECSILNGLIRFPLPPHIEGTN